MDLKLDNGLNQFNKNANLQGAFGLSDEKEQEVGLDRFPFFPVIQKSVDEGISRLSQFSKLDELRKKRKNLGLSATYIQWRSFLESVDFKLSFLINRLNHNAMDRKSGKMSNSEYIKQFIYILAEIFDYFIELISIANQYYNSHLYFAIDPIRNALINIQDMLLRLFETGLFIPSNIIYHINLLKNDPFISNSDKTEIIRELLQITDRFASIINKEQKSKNKGFEVLWQDQTARLEKNDGRAWSCKQLLKLNDLLRKRFGNSDEFITQTGLKDENEEEKITKRKQEQEAIKKPMEQEKESQIRYEQARLENQKKEKKRKKQEKKEKKRKKQEKKERKRIKKEKEERDKRAHEQAILNYKKRQEEEARIAKEKEEARIAKEKEEARIAKEIEEKVRLKKKKKTQEKRTNSLFFGRRHKQGFHRKKN